MTNQSGFEGAEKIKDCIEQIGDEVVSESTVEQDGSESLMLACNHGGTSYMIQKPGDIRGFRIIFRYNLAEEIASLLPEERIEEWVDRSLDIDEEFKTMHEAAELSDEEPPKSAEESPEVIFTPKTGDIPPEIEAGQNVLESLDKDVLESFGLNLFQEISDPEVAAGITHTPNGYFEGFSIARKVYPRDSGFSLTEFNHSVQAVVSLGTFGRNYTTQLLESEMDEIEISGADQG